MIRKAFVIRARAGMTEEYIRRHNPIWPELETVLSENGIANYSIFLRESTSELFGYMEITNEDLFLNLEHNEICKKWWRYMTEVLMSENDNSVKAIEEMLREIFYLK